MTKSKKPKRVAFEMFIPDKLTIRHIGKSVFKLKVDIGIKAILYNLDPLISKPIRLEKITFEDDTMTVEGFEDD